MLKIRTENGYKQQQEEKTNPMMKMMKKKAKMSGDDDDDDVLVDLGGSSSTRSKNGDVTLPAITRAERMEHLQHIRNTLHSILTQPMPNEKNSVKSDERNEEEEKTHSMKKKNTDLA